MMWPRHKGRRNSIHHCHCLQYVNWKRESDADKPILLLAYMCHSTIRMQWYLSEESHCCWWLGYYIYLNACDDKRTSSSPSPTTRKENFNHFTRFQFAHWDCFFRTFWVRRTGNEYKMLMTFQTHLLSSVARRRGRGRCTVDSSWSENGCIKLSQYITRTGDSIVQKSLVSVHVWMSMMENFQGCI